MSEALDFDLLCIGSGPPVSGGGPGPQTRKACRCRRKAAINRRRVPLEWRTAVVLIGWHSMMSLFDRLGPVTGHRHRRSAS